MSAKQTIKVKRAYHRKKGSKSKPKNAINNNSKKKRCILCGK